MNTLSDNGKANTETMGINNTIELENSLSWSMTEKLHNHSCVDTAKPNVLTNKKCEMEVYTEETIEQDNNFQGEMNKNSPVRAEVV